jgi:hypothetical protein
MVHDRADHPSRRAGTVWDGERDHGSGARIYDDQQRKSVAIEYPKAFDNGGVTSTGKSILDLFTDDAQVYFPKWGLGNGPRAAGAMCSKSATGR